MEVIEVWREVWRKGFAAALSTPGLTALAEALRTDDPRLIQGNTVNPPPLNAGADALAEGACAIGYCCWQGDGAATVEAVEMGFAKACFDADQTLKETAACRWFLNWFDDTPRAELKRDLLPEVEAEIARRTPTPTGA